MDTKELTMMMMIKMENDQNPFDHHMDIPCDPFCSLPLDSTATASAFGSNHAADDQKTFMELLGFQDFTTTYNKYSLAPNSSIFDNMMPPSSLSMDTEIPTSSARPDHKKEDDEVGEESSVVQPSSPNSSSLSSPPAAAAAAAADQQLHKPLKQCMRWKKTMGGDEQAVQTKKKKEREARFAFMTRTEIDNLDDGYRWRKYGQKAVKNSPFPRSYYRCTSASCNVKKRVERCMGDPSFIVTTYEGQHIHPSPNSAIPSTTNYSSFNQHHHQHLINPTGSYAPAAMMKQLDQGGLLQDVLP